MANSYPRFVLSFWSDSSPPAHRHVLQPTLYGIRCQVKRGGDWINLEKDGQPLIFKTLDEASLGLLELEEATRKGLANDERVPS